MNKTEVINQVAAQSGVDTETCARVLNALEDVLTNELSYSDGKTRAFDKIYSLLTYFKSKKENK